MLGQLWKMLTSAEFRLTAFVASTWSMVWHDGNSNTLFIAWMAASHPDCWPTHSCCTPATFRTSSLTVGRMGLLIILLATSPIPMGLIHGCLSMAMSLHDVSSFRPTGSTKVVHRRRPMAATALHRSHDASSKDELLHFQLVASKLLLLLQYVSQWCEYISWPVILSNRMGCISKGASSSGRIVEG